MKIQNKPPLKSAVILIAFFFSMAIFSCNCKDPKPDTPVAKGTLGFHLHTNVDENEVENLDSVYPLSNGRKISVHFAQLYLSHIQLVKLDGSTYEVPGTIVLQQKENEQYTIGEVPAGNYKSVSFQVGLDATVRDYKPNADAALNHPDMWFESTGASGGWGYRFVNFQGKIDTTAGGNGTGAAMKPFELKLGGSSAYRLITMPEQDFTVAPNQTQYIHMTVNYAYLLHGIDLTSPASLSIQNPGENQAVQVTMDANMTAGTEANSEVTSAMFTYEH